MTRFPPARVNIIVAIFTPFLIALIVFWLVIVANSPSPKAQLTDAAVLQLLNIFIIVFELRWDAYCASKSKRKQTNRLELPSTNNGHDAVFEQQHSDQQIELKELLLHQAS